ncbi:MAG: GNAT family N-acetyltransferase [Bacillota bacterium]
MKIIAVDEATFEQVHALGCLSCTYWHGPVEGDRCEARREMFRDGRCRGKLALTDDGSAMGFIQYGPLATFPTFAELRHGFDVDIPSHAWVIPCIITHKEHRRQGVSRALLTAVLAEAATEGRTLEVIGMEEADFDHISGGPAGLYRTAGFEQLGQFRDGHGMNVLLRLP